jgi:UDP-N-acetylglucosamine--N-acetylmuramyl-(pentapeptide) pyrophosphoryl-undecaprenol N-acetylglucosamine transferase
MKKPIFLHDGNARVGKANRILSRLAKGLALSFPAVNSKTLHCPCELTGLPLRQALVDGGVLPKAEAIQKLNELFGSDFTADSPTLLVFGGSLGALKINSSFIMPRNEPEMKKLQVIHLTGPGKLEELTEQYKMFPGKYILREASGEMGVIYSAVDAVICRSGGSTVSELAFFGKYALLIPFPYAAEHHQDDNARYLASGGGAEILFDADCSIDKMQDFVRRFLADPEKFRTLGANSGKLAFPDAAGAVIRMIQKNIK